MFALTIAGATEHLPEEQREAAMQRYWSARQGGDATAHLVRVEAPPEPPTPPTAPRQVSPVAEERITRQSQWLEKAGFSVPPPIFAPGTRVLPLGDSNFQLERRRVEELPRFPDAANRVIEEIGREQRHDVPVKLGELHMEDSGELVANGEHLGLEVDAFQQLLVASGLGAGARYLSEKCGPELRAYNVNRQFAGRDRELMFRTRRGQGGQRTAFAVVTPSYTAVDTDDVLREAMNPLDDTHSELSYDGTGVGATALFMPDQVVDLAAGDVFKVGVRIETDDTGRGRIRVSGVVWRNLCLNLLIIGEGTVETVSAVHRGDRQAMLDAVRNGVDRARETVGPFLEAWGHARTVKVDIESTFKGWIETKQLPSRNEKDGEQLFDALVDAWKIEPGDTLADAVNAVTRAAHRSTSNLNVQQALERRAARLLIVAV